MRGAKETDGTGNPASALLIQSLIEQGWIAGLNDKTLGPVPEGTNMTRAAAEIAVPLILSHTGKRLLKCRAGILRDKVVSRCGSGCFCRKELPIKLVETLNYKFPNPACHSRGRRFGPVELHQKKPQIRQVRINQPDGFFFPGTKSIDHLYSADTKNVLGASGIVLCPGADSPWT